MPKLCATDRLEPFGSCRVCLVEIDGRKGTPASCTTPVEPGMRVSTQTPRLPWSSLVDPRRIDMVLNPYIAAYYHLQLQPGTYAAVAQLDRARGRHPDLLDRGYVEERCEPDAPPAGRSSSAARRTARRPPSR